MYGPIEGRLQECLTTAAGKVINPGLLGHYLFVHKGHGDAVRHYQIVQEGSRRVTLLVVPGSGWSQRSAVRLRDDMLGLLGPELEAEVEIVPEIRPERSGKRPIIKTAALPG